MNRCYEAWQEALTLVRSSEETHSRHQAVLSLERDTVACEHLRQVHLHWYVVAMLKASFDTICQSTSARVNISIATGLHVAICRISAERDFCAAPLDAILAKIAHIVVVQDDLSCMMSPACLPRSSAQVMTPPSPTTMMPSSPPSHTHPTSYLGAVLSPKGGDCKPSSHVLQVTTAQESAAIMLHRMARRHKRPCCRPGHRNVRLAPNPADEAIPSHLLPTMGGTSMPTTTHTKLACANDWDPCLPMSSTSSMTLPSPSLQPFTIEGGTSTYSGGGASMIPSGTMASFFHRGSAHDKSTVLVVFVAKG